MSTRHRLTRDLEAFGRRGRNIDQDFSPSGRVLLVDHAFEAVGICRVADLEASELREIPTPCLFGSHPPARVRGYVAGIRLYYGHLIAVGRDKYLLVRPCAQYV